MVVVGELDEDFGCQIAFAALIAGIGGLGAVQKFSNCFLMQVVVFAQVADALVDHVPASLWAISLYYSGC